MAERRLNFNAPLLSTRRMHNTALSVRTKKSHNFTHDSTNTNEIGLYHQVTEAASVPFTWEHAPGRLKGHDSRPQQVCDQVFTPCLPPGKVMDILNFPMEKTIDVNLSSKVEEEESEDVFSDARDTISHNGSLSVSHSITGVSGYGVVETKNRSDDLQSRDFMLNRFLPAAKAMTVEQPHYGSNRKPSTFMPEPRIRIRDLVPEEKRQTPNRYAESTLVPYYDHKDIDAEEISVEDDDDASYLSRRGCGMLPHLCFKDSVAMLNTMSGFKAKQKSSLTSPSHDQVKSSKVSLLKSRFQSVKKLPLDSVSKHKLRGKVISPVHSNISNLTSVASMSSSPYRHPRCMSPFRTSSPFHPAGVLDTRKETESLRANRLNNHIRNRSQELLYSKGNGSTSSLLEKTVYVDTEDSPNTNDQYKSNVMVSPVEAEKKPNTTLELEELGKNNNSPGRSPLAPPSPKKPSESWLLHNLPSVVTSQTPSRRYTFPPRKQSFNENSRFVAKWETIVKTSHMHRDHIRYSEELVAHTSLQ